MPLKLIVGCSDAKKLYEEVVIRTYWSKWLEEMKVKSFEIKQADLPSNMEKVIRDFLLEK